MPSPRLLLLMGCVMALIACSSSSKRADVPRVVCKMVKVDKDAAYFENRSFDAAGALVGVWTNRVSNRFITAETAKQPDVKNAVTVYVESLRLKADGGDPGFQHELGLLHETGRFVAMDARQAHQWYLRAAMQGYAPAQHELGMMYQLGQCVVKDYTESYKWFELAAKGGEKRSEENRRMMVEFMTQAQVIEARKRAADFKPIKENGN